MANLADVIVGDVSDSGIGNSEAARKALTEAVAEPETSSVDNRTQQTTPEADDGIPAKFKGKSAKEIVEAYQNLESQAGRLANELGVQRQLTDRFLDLKRSDDLSRNGGSKTERPKPVPVTTNDILDRPQETLERVVDSRVSSGEESTNTRIQQLEAQLAQTKFESKHKDYRTTVSDQNFINWVKASPLRMRAASVANGGDWQIADELFTEFESTQASRNQTTTTQTERTTSNLDAARSASFTSSGNASGTDGKAKQGGKIFKRADLMALRISDPDAYYDDAFQEQVLLAHAEGRVR